MEGTDAMLRRAASLVEGKPLRLVKGSRRRRHMLFDVPVLGTAPFHAVFIRAPLIEKVGPDVEVLSQLDDGTIVAARQGNLLATSFHPELTHDGRFHEYFLSFIGGSPRAGKAGARRT